MTGLQGAADRLHTLATNVRSAASDLDDKSANAATNHDSVNSLIADARSAINGLSSDYDTNLKPQLDSLAATLSVGADVPVVGAFLA